MRIKDSRDWTPRLVSALLRELLTGKVIVPSEYAQEAGVHPRTVRRYLESLERTGWPMIVEKDCLGSRGYQGFYSFPRECRLK